MDRLLIFVLMLACSSSALSTEVSGPQYYGPLYRADYRYGDNTPFPTVSEVLNDWWEEYKIDWNVGPNGLSCSYSFTPDQNGINSGHFGWFGLNGQCSGGGNIYGTLQCPKGYQPVGSNCLPDGKPKLEKNLGTDECGIGNPIIPNIANKIQAEIDYQHRGNPSLYLSRTYNSQGIGIVGWNGNGWSFNFDKLIRVFSSSVLLQRKDGKRIFFSLVNGTWIPDSDVALSLLQIKDSNGATTGWTVKTEADEIEDYNSAGKLIRLTDRQGKSLGFSYQSGRLIEVTDDFSGAALTFNYDASGRFAALTVPSGEVYRYGYDSYGNLATVTYPDETPADLTDNPKKTYVYGELEYTSGANQPHALTGIIDENGKRYATYHYDASGKAISTEHAGGVEHYAVAYSPDGSSTSVTDPLGSVRTTHFTTVLGVVKNTGIDQPGGSGCSASASQIGYDANGNITSRTDFNGNVSCYAYDLSRNLETARIEGLAPGSSCPADVAAYTPVGDELKTLTQWHADYRLPTQIDEAGRRTTFGYNGKGDLLQKTVLDTATGQSRTWSYTYNSLGQVLTADGPRTDVNDVTTYSYYVDSTADHKPGDLATIVNALGHTTVFNRYDGSGRPLMITEPNGLATTLAYDPRGRLTQIIVDSKVTQYDYDPAGNLIKVTSPTDDYLSYTYDDAHRLIRTDDNLGNHAVYTLDAMGNRLKTELFDPTGQLARSQSRVYDALSRLQDVIQQY